VMTPHWFAGLAREWRLAAALVLCLCPSLSLAQGLQPAVDVDPPAFPFRAGPLWFAPGLRLTQLGVDTNIFVDAAQPQSDFVASLQPELNLFLRPRAMRVTGFLAADFNYFQEFSSERYIAPKARGRVDLLLSRLRPYAGIGRVDTRDRPNREIDARARHVDTELGGGLAFDLSPVSFIYGSVTRLETDFRTGERFAGIVLEDVLDKTTTSYDAGVRLSLTPLTTLSLAAGYLTDDFARAPTRDAISRYLNAELAFSADAIIRGTARVGYRDFRPDDPLVDDFRGLTTQIGLVYPVLDRGSLALTAFRDVMYSYEEVEGYYVETTADLSYTHRLFGGWDAQVRGALTRLAYGDEVFEGDRVDGLRTAAVGAGYNFADQSRLGLTWEWSRRASDLRADRRYRRQRLFASWTYTF
jgi:hypothetical protein